MRPSTATLFNAERQEVRVFLFAEDHCSAKTEGPGAGPSERLVPVVSRLNAGDETAVVDLFAMLERGACFFLRRKLGDTARNQEMARRILLKAAQAALDRQIHSPAELLHFVLTNVKVAIQHELGGGNAERPEQPSEEWAARTTGAVECMTRQEREVVTRFYGRGESVDSICAALRIDEGRFFQIAAKARKAAGQAPSTRAMTARAGS